MRRLVPGGEARVAEMTVGEHVHLEELLEDAPGPGDHRWLDLADGLLADLSLGAGVWAMTIPLGEVQDVPSGLCRPCGVVDTSVDA